MPAPMRFDITANGLYKLYGRSSYSSLPTPQVQVSGTGWAASLVFAMQSTPHGGDSDGQPTLTNIPYKQQGNYGQTFPAGLPVARNGVYEFNTGGVSLWVTVSGLPVGNTQNVSLLCIPDAVPTPQPNTINLSTGLNIDTIPVNYPPDLALQFELAKNNA